MGRIVEQLRAVGARRAALFVVITAAVAVGFYFGVREAGVEPPTEAGVTVSQQRQAEPAQQDERDEESVAGQLTLTLTASHMCEVDGKSRDIHASRRDNDDGTSEEVFDFWPLGQCGDSPG